MCNRSFSVKISSNSQTTNPLNEDTFYGNMLVLYVVQLQSKLSG